MVECGTWPGASQECPGAAHNHEMPRFLAFVQRPAALLSLSVVLAGSAGLLGQQPAGAHEGVDPSVHSVLDTVEPALPPGVAVALVPSVVDELVLTNPTVTPLEVLATGGEVLVRISAAGVEGNLASPDWYASAAPEGAPALPADVVREQGRGPARYLKVTTQPVWSEFDPRVRPTGPVPRAVRAAGARALLTTWAVPLRLGGVAYAVHGHIEFSPVRGALTVVVTTRPAGLTVAALQGRLPGLFVQVPAGRTLVVRGQDGRPFLRFIPAGVQANPASSSWQQDQRARGLATAAAPGADGWIPVNAGSTYGWLDARLRYPADLPTRAVLALATPSVVQDWVVPVTVDGAPASIAGTVTWVPRAVALRQLAGPAATGSGSGTGLPLAAGVALLGTGLLLGLRHRTRRQGLIGTDPSSK